MSFRRVWRLSLSLAKAEFKLRNEGSILGIFWYLLNPLLMFSFLLLIFSDRLGGNIPNYPVYLLLGIILFNFFKISTTESIGIILDNNFIIKSINFPKKALIGGLVLKSLFSHLFEIILIILILIIFKIPFFVVIFYLPILFFFCLFIYGMSLILSSLSIYFRDIGNIWNFASTLIWFGTPIFYAIENQTRLFYLNLFNPMYYFITVTREIIIYSNLPELWMIFGLGVYSLLFLIIGLFIFNKLKYKFAEMI